MFNGLASEHVANHWRDIDKMFLSNDLQIPGYGTHNPLPPNIRLRHILSHPSLEVRATDLGYFFTYSAAEDMKNFFPLLLESIFGFKNNIGWGIRMLTRQYSPREADAVIKFLSPNNGPLINLAYRLMEDSNLRYEYPVSALPKPLADKIFAGDVPPFFVNKVNTPFASFISAVNNSSMTLQLNPFEYYFVYFCMGNILGATGEPAGNYLAGWGCSPDTVYSALFEEYLAFFFPCDGLGVPTASFLHFPAAEAPFLTSQPMNRTPYSPPRAQRDIRGNVAVHRPYMFKDSVFQDQGDGGRFAREKTYHAMQPYAQKDTWRSDTILHLCMELWMNVEVREDLSRILFDSKLPSVDLVKSVRLLVRQIHYFVNNTNVVALHPMEDIKRQTFPLFQKKLYIFLKDLFQRWPMDNSFRVVYETWLSYIQPWRYLDYSTSNSKSKNREPFEQYIDFRWFNFMMENILFYTTMYLQLLPRFERVDLTTPKNALMLFRVAKVYTVSDNIKHLLMEVEKNLESINADNYSWHGTDMLNRTKGFGSMYHRLQGTQIFNPHYTDGGVGPGSSSQSSKIAHIKQILKELESPQFVYIPLFDAENKSKMRKILQTVHQAAEDLHEATERPTNPKASVSWIDWFKSKVYNTDEGTSVPDKIKSYNHLEFSMDQLCHFFDIPINEVINSASATRSIYDNSCNASAHYTSYEEMDTSSPYNSSSAANIASKLLPSSVPIKSMLVSIGNPDEALPKRDENRPALKICRWLSNKLNAKYGNYIEARFYEKSMKGKLYRAIFAHPKEYHLVDKSVRHHPVRSSHYLPPRVNLRFLASTRLWYFILALFVAACYFDLSPLGCIFWAFALVLLYISCRVLREPQTDLEYFLNEFKPYVAPQLQPQLAFKSPSPFKHD